MDLYAMQCLARLTYYINSLCPTQRHGRPRKTTQRGGVYCAEDESGSGLSLAPVSKTRRVQEDYVEISCGATRHLPYLSPGVPIDPISLEPLGVAKYTYKTASGVLVQYNVETLVQYLLYTGDFKDPISRAALNAEDVASIDVCAASHGLPLPHLTPYFQQQREAAEAQTRNRRNTIISLEACIGEIVCDMLKVVETASLYSGNMRLAVLLSEFEAPFAELKREDIEGARQALDGWKAFVRGPPKRPTTDRYGRVDQVLSGLESYWDAPRDDAALEACRRERGACLNKGQGMFHVTAAPLAADALHAPLAVEDCVVLSTSATTAIDAAIDDSATGEVEGEEEASPRDSIGEENGPVVGPAAAAASEAEDDAELTMQIEMWSQFCA